MSPFPLLPKSAGHDTEELKILIISTLIMFVCETMANFLPEVLIGQMGVTALVRLTQIALLMWFIYLTPNGILFTGLLKSKLFHGFKIGLIWSFIFGIIVLLSGLLFYLNNINPLKFIHSDLSRDRVMIFFITAGIIGPVAEELYFRGIIFSFLRKFGILTAIGISTIIFALFHLQYNSYGSLPVFQIIGGLIFAAAFEYSDSLIAPVIIHIIGNTAIFSIVFFSKSFSGLINP